MNIAGRYTQNRCARLSRLSSTILFTRQSCCVKGGLFLLYAACCLLLPSAGYAICIYACVEDGVARSFYVLYKHAVWLWLCDVHTFACIGIVYVYGRRHTNDRTAANITHMCICSTTFAQSMYWVHGVKQPPKSKRSEVGRTRATVVFEKWLRLFGPLAVQIISKFIKWMEILYVCVMCMAVWNSHWKCSGWLQRTFLSVCAAECMELVGIYLVVVYLVC